MANDRKRLLAWGLEAAIYPLGTMALGLAAWLFLCAVGQGEGMWCLLLLPLPVAAVIARHFGALPLLALWDALRGATQTRRVRIKTVQHDRAHSLRRLGLPENRRRYVLTDEEGRRFFLLATDAERKLLLAHPHSCVVITYGRRSRVAARIHL